MMKNVGRVRDGAPPSQRGAQSIQRAIAVLRAVGDHNDRGAHLSMIARKAGLHIATTHRILSALTAEGFLTYDPISKLYHLGIELYLLAGSARQFAIRSQFRRALEQIADKTSDTVFLMVRSGNDALCIDRVEGKSPIRTVPIDIGAQRPLGIGAGSMALIAFLHPDRTEEIIVANSSRYPQFKKLTLRDIRKLAKSSRSAGYVVSAGLFHDGVTSIGLPIFDERGEVIAAVTVSSISQKMNKGWRLEIVAIVREVVRAEGYGVSKQD